MGANPSGFNTYTLFKNGKLRETAKAFLREVYLEYAGGAFGDDCWELPFSRQNPEGYRHLTWAGKTIMAHRLIYELFVEPVPEGYLVLHGCDNPACCNPKHLRVGTSKDNSQDMVRKGRARNGSSQKTQCPQGHLYNMANTRMYRGRRYCRACSVSHSSAYQKKQRQVVT